MDRLFYIMEPELPKTTMQTDILAFLRSIQDAVNSVEELLQELRAENNRAEVYGQQNLEELMELSNYQWQLEQVEMKLKAPSLIRISFAEGWTPRVLNHEEQVEALILDMIVKFTRFKKSE